MNKPLKKSHDLQSRSIPVGWAQLPDFIREIKTQAVLEGRPVSLPADAPAHLRERANASHPGRTQ